MILIMRIQRPIRLVMPISTVLPSLQLITNGSQLRQDIFFLQHQPFELLKLIEDVLLWVFLTHYFFGEPNNVLEHSQELGRMVPEILGILGEGCKYIFVVILVPQDTSDNLQVEIDRDREFLLHLLASRQGQINRCSTL